MRAGERTKLNKKLRVLLQVVVEYPETKEFIENNIKEACEVESITVKEVIYFVYFVL